MILPQQGISLQHAELYQKITKIQTVIIAKLLDLKKMRIDCLCEHFIHMPEQCQSYSSSTNYYEQFWKLFLTTSACQTKMQQLKLCLQQMMGQLDKIESLFEKRDRIRQENLKLKPKQRRKANKIQRLHQCQQNNCHKAYGSSLALKLHAKMKHNKI